MQYARFKMAKDSIIRGNPLKRSEHVKDGGAMMTTVGSSNIYGQFSENRGVVPPRRAGKEAAQVEELREDMKISMPGKLYVQCRLVSILMHQ